MSLWKSGSQRPAADRRWTATDRWWRAAAHLRDIRTNGRRRGIERPTIAPRNRHGSRAFSTFVIEALDHSQALIVFIFGRSQHDTARIVSAVRGLVPLFFGSFASSGSITIAGRPALDRNMPPLSAMERPVPAQSGPLVRFGGRWVAQEQNVNRRPSYAANRLICERCTP
jgi:hypothetical protein